MKILIIMVLENKI